MDDSSNDSDDFDLLLEKMLQRKLNIGLRYILLIKIGKNLENIIIYSKSYVSIPIAFSYIEECNRKLLITFLG